MPLAQKEKENPPRDIRERTLDFAVRIIKLTEGFPNTPASKIIANQIIRSGTSIGANSQEALAGYSKDDFIYKTNLALREARETLYWLRVVERLKLLESNHVGPVVREADEISRILGAIVSKARGKRK